MLNNIRSGAEAAPGSGVRVLIIHNPDSGDNDHVRQHLVELVAGAGHDVSDHSSDDAWQDGLDDPPDLIAVAGGDGTVAKVARATAGRSLPLTILPTGTANNIAMALGLGGIPHEALIAGWSRGVYQPFDVGTARGPWAPQQFLESVGIGVLARMMAEIDGGGARYVNELDGRDSRVAAALEVLERVLRDMPPVRCAIELDDVRVSGEYVLVEILNFGMAGPNLRLAPKANGADGLLDVVVVEAHERARLHEHLSRMRIDPQNVPRLRGRTARRVRLSCDPCAVHLDDTLWPGYGGAAAFVTELTITPAALTFLVPYVSGSAGPG